MKKNKLQALKIQLEQYFVQDTFIDLRISVKDYIKIGRKYIGIQTIITFAIHPDPDAEVMDITVCPYCKGEVDETEQGLFCFDCKAFLKESQLKHIFC